MDWGTVRSRGSEADVRQVQSVDPRWPVEESFVVVVDDDDDDDGGIPSASAVPLSPPATFLTVV